LAHTAAFCYDKAASLALQPDNRREGWLTAGAELGGINAKSKMQNAKLECGSREEPRIDPLMKVCAIRPTLFPILHFEF